MAIWAQVLEPYSLTEIANAALEKKLYIAHGEKYALKRKEANHLRLGFAGLNENEIHEALKILLEVAHQTKISQPKSSSLSEMTA